MSVAASAARPVPVEGQLLRITDKRWILTSRHPGEGRGPALRCSAACQWDFPPICPAAPRRQGRKKTL